MKKSTASLVPKQEYDTEIVISKSKFITTIRRIQSIQEMRIFYGDMQKRHPKANHHCWGMVAGNSSDSSHYGCSDDGEPSGTAGKPILTVLQYSGKSQTGVIVSRYFGGVKLGKGGLVRAYTEAAKRILAVAEFTVHSKMTRMIVSLSYPQENTLRSLLDSYQLEADFEYGEEITVQIEIAEHLHLELKERLLALFRERIRIQHIREAQ